jgi:hypothetical protein
MSITFFSRLQAGNTLQDVTGFRIELFRIHFRANQSLGCRIVTAFICQHSGQMPSSRSVLAMLLEFRLAHNGS